MGRKSTAKKQKAAPRRKVERRPPRLRADRRRRDPEAFVGVSPQDVPPGAPLPWDPAFEGETFTEPDVDEAGTPKPGRPRKHLDIATVRKLALMHPTDAELAAFFDVSVRLVERRKLLDPEFRRALDLGRAEGKLSVRRLQVQQAQRGDWRALEWLGRNWLGQRKEPIAEGPGVNQGKSPLLETLERMEAAIKADAEAQRAASSSGESNVEGDDVADQVDELAGDDAPEGEGAAPPFRRA